MNKPQWEIEYWELTKRSQFVDHNKIVDFIRSKIEKSYQQGVEDMRRKCVVNVGMLRQWLNEDRITDTKKLVTNEDIEHWLNYKSN